LATFGELSCGRVPTGLGGGEMIARRKHAHCKFMIVDLRSQSLEKFSLKSAGRALRKWRSHSQIVHAS